MRVFIECWYYLFRLFVGYLGFVLIVLTILLLLLVTRCLCVNILFGWCYLFLFEDFVLCFVCDIVWFVIIGCLFVFVICVSLRMFVIIVLFAFYWFGLFVYYAVWLVGVWICCCRRVWCLIDLVVCCVIGCFGFV